jgi:hypothetical protein
MKEKKIYRARTTKQYVYTDKHCRQNWRLQHDNNPIHTSHVTKQFIKNNVPQSLEWSYYKEYLIDVTRKVKKEN